MHEAILVRDNWPRVLSANLGKGSTLGDDDWEGREGTNRSGQVRLGATGGHLRECDGHNCQEPARQGQGAECPDAGTHSPTHPEAANPGATHE